MLAVPVAPAGWPARIGGEADETASVHEPEFFYAIGQFYEDFSQTADEEVLACLARNRAARGAGATDAEVRIKVGELDLAGHLVVPQGAAGVVLFAHGSGSSRHSPRNRAVAEDLNRAGLGTLLFDLLTEEEAADRANVFDTELLADRLARATAWLGGQPGIGGLRTGYFGASTGAAAALWAASDPAATVAAVVSRGGRPDLAGPRLAAVRAPTLLIVGGHDPLVVDLNEQAQRQLRCENELVIVPGATHLFEEPGTLERVGELAAGWFGDHF